MIPLGKFEIAFKNLPKNVLEAEVNADSRSELMISVSNGEQKSCSYFEKTTLYIRASNDKTGTVLTENLEEDPYALMEKAIANAKYSQSTTREIMNGKNYKQPKSDGDIKEISTADMLHAAITLENTAFACENLASIALCSIRRTFFERRVLNSKGLDISSKNTYLMVKLDLSLKRETGENVTGKYSVCVKSIEDIDYKAIVEKAVQDANKYDLEGILSPCTIKNGNYRAILSKEVARNIILTSWQEFCGAYMNTGMSIFRNETGQIIGSQLLNITDDPSPSNWAYNLSLDSEGTICNKKAIVKDGKLVTPLHMLQSASDCNEKPTGNAGRSALMTGTTPINLITIPTVIYIEPGNSTDDEMIEQMKDGIYITYSLDVFHSINIISGEFSIPVGGILYENGNPIGTLDQITIAGNLKDLFLGLEAVGNEVCIDEFVYNNYCFGAPSLLVNHLAFGSKN